MTAILNEVRRLLADGLTVEGIAARLNELVSDSQGEKKEEGGK